MLDLFGMLDTWVTGLPLGLVHTNNLGESLFTKRTLIFAIGPFFNAFKTKGVIASVNFGQIGWLGFIHTDATAGSLGFVTLFRSLVVCRLISLETSWCLL